MHPPRIAVLCRLRIPVEVDIGVLVATAAECVSEVLNIVDEEA